MEMEPLIQEINNLTNNEYKFTLKSAFLNQSADFCVLEILYRDGIMLKQQVKDLVKNHILSLVPSSFKYDIQFIKNFISEDRISDDVKVFMAKTFPSMSYSLTSVKLDGKKFVAEFAIDNLSFEHAKNKRFDLAFEKYFKGLYEDFDFACTYISDSVYVEDEEAMLKENYKEEIVDTTNLRVIEFFDTVHLVGDEIDGVASYIKDKKVPEEKVTICGKIKAVKEIIIKRKPKAKDGEEGESTEEVENVELEKEEDDTPKYQRKLYKFSLEDFTGEMTCVFFSNKENQAKIEKLDVGSVVVFRGAVEEDKYSGGVSFKVHDIAYCSIPEGLEEYIVYKQEKPFYELIKPEPIVTYAQDDLLSFMAVDETPEYLKGKTFVCFDFETTGLKYHEGDKVVEIGAVKIVNGKIVEKFESLVNPEGKKSDPKAQETHKIKEEDLENAPLPDVVFQDFYKFTRGAILTGYNIVGFDMIFLRGEGKRLGWNFDNECVDVIDFSRKYVHGVKNYRLGTVAEKLGVKLENAHRAVFDTIATAEILIKLAKNVE